MRSSNSTRSGVSRIEFLVVLVVVLVLLTVSIPSVQQSREEARRESCRNNLKQLGLALNNYHDTHHIFPFGATHTQLPRLKQKSPLHGIGPSFYGMILPFIGEKELYDAMTWEGVCPGYVYEGNWQYPSAGKYNGFLMSGKQIPLFRCPSTPLDLRPNLQTEYHSCYPGISGAVSEHGFTELRTSLTRPHFTNKAIVSGGGILFANSNIRIRDITDGTANTMILGEASDFYQDNSGNLYISTASGEISGWLMGTRVTGNGYTLDPGNIEKSEQVFNVFSIRYSPNSVFDDSPGTGMKAHFGSNNPLCSPHEGGVQVCFADGTVRFLSDTIDLVTLYQLATRDDGLPFEKF